MNEKNFRTDALCCPIQSVDYNIIDELLDFEEKDTGIKYNERYYTFIRNEQAYFVPEGDINGNNRNVSYEVFMMLLFKFGGSFIPMYMLPTESIEE